MRIQHSLSFMAALFTGDNSLICADAGDIPGMLRRGFVGYPQMASVLRQWLKIAGVDDGDDAAWKALKKEVFKRLDPSALDDAASAESA